MTKEYVQQYAELERKHWWFLVRQKIILQFLNKHISLQQGQQLQVLNIGAAAGASGEWLAAFGQVASVETEPLFIEYLKKQDIAVTEASVTNLPFADNSFDLICAFDVIEHVADDQQALKEMARVCRSNGTLCITVPAFTSLWSQHDSINGHYRRYTKNGLRSLFETCSQLRSVETRYFNSLLFLPIAAARKISNLFKKNKDQPVSDFAYFKSSAVINSLLKKIFSLELPLMKLLHFPFGVSLISVLKKKDS